MSIKASSASIAAHPPAQRLHERRRAAMPETPRKPRRGAGLLWDFLFNKPRNTRPTGTIPVVRLTRAALEAAPDRSLYRLGHSTMLLKLRGGFWLTDPVFSERASPVQWAGPKRFHAPPIALEDLPPIRGVLLSHDHSDHLDKAAIRHLARSTDVFLAPLGVGDRLIRWGVPAEKVRQLGWWQATDVDGVQFTATPAQHFFGARTARSQSHAVGVMGDRG